MSETRDNNKNDAQTKSLIISGNLQHKGGAETIMTQIIRIRTDKKKTEIYVQGQIFHVNIWRQEEEIVAE